MEGNDSKGRQEIFSDVVRAGRRTYFFDVKKTRKGDLYLTITESKKVYNDDEGTFHFEKHKLFLYKEDFDKFSDALSQSVGFIKENVGDFLEDDEQEKSGNVIENNNFEESSESEAAETSDFTDVDFEDLDKE